MIARSAHDIAFRSPSRAAGPRRLARVLAAGVVAAGMLAAPAAAQDGDLARQLEILKRDVQDLQSFVYKGEGGGSGASGSGGGGQLSGGVAGRLQVKIQEVQDSLRELTGRVEEAEYRMRRLNQRVEKLASDVDFRLNRLEARAGVGGADGQQGNATSQRQSGGGQSGQGTTVISSSGAVREDGSLNTTQILGQLRTNSSGEVVSAERGAAADGSNAAGPTDGSEAPKPRPQQSASTSGGAASDGSGGSGGGDADATASASSGGQSGGGQDSGQASGQSGDGQSAGGQSAGQSGGGTSGGGTSGGASGDGGSTQTASTTALPEGTVQEQYQYAFSLLRERDYAAAESAMREFVERHRDSSLTGNAMYWLGETYYARGAYRDAASTFLDAYTKYPDGNKATHSLLKLAMSLGALDKTDAACQAFATLQKNPNAGDRVLRMAEDEAAKLGCS